MTLIKWKPNQLSLNEFDRMINDIFNDGWNFSALNNNQYPAVDIVEDKDKFVLSADFPGFEKKNINLNVEDGVLKLSAQKDDKNVSDGSFKIQERQASTIQRSFTLPDIILEDKISAKYKNGTLQVSLPKAEEVKAESHSIKIS